MPNPLSLIMLIDKIKDIKEFANLRELKQEYWERAKEYFKDSKLLEIVAESITLMLTNINISDAEITTIKDHLYEGRLENMFELAVKYDVQKVRAEGMQEGLEKGRQEGVKQGELNVARRMLAKGNSIEDVADMTGLSVEEVCKLQH